jgi:maltose alpha-D-glucosyltransferase/alpha-amylase
MHMLLFSMPGTPVLYYGDEIGMGDNYWLGDRNGVRTPMQWSPDRNAGFSRVNSQQLYLPVIIDPEYHYEAINVENQERNPSSLLWWVRQRLALRGRLKSFGRGTIEFLPSDNSKILCFLRKFEDEVIMVAANLSHTPQSTTVDLSEFAGATPVELSGQVSFPSVKSGDPYLLMLGGYDVFWLRLKQTGIPALQGDSQSPLPDLPAVKMMKDVLERPVVNKLCDQVLPAFIASARWFRSKTREIASVSVEASTAAPIQGKKEAVFLCVLQVRFTEGNPERYVVPLGFAPNGRASEIPAGGALARVSVGGQFGLLCDANHLSEFRRGLLRSILLGMRLPLGKGHLQGIAGPPPEDGSGTGLDFATLESQVLNAEQSNTSLLYPDGYFLKTFRRLDEGMNPDPEITRFLTERTSFRNSPSFRGTLEWQRPDQEPVTVCFAQGLVRADRDAWALTLESLAKYFETLVTHHRFEQETPNFPTTLSPLDFSQLTDFQQELVGAYGEFAHLLGTRTGELHQALGSRKDDAAFAPEAYSTLYQRSVYQSIRTLSKRNLALLKKTLPQLPESLNDDVKDLMGREEQILSVIGRLLPHKIEVDKIRIHGDYHLGQVLFTGKDFVILDFEGEPARAASERRLKRCALRDVAGMIRSFHYAAHVGLRAYAEGHGRSVEALLPWAEGWYRSVAGIFLKAYRDQSRGSNFIPQSEVDFHILLEVFLLEKAVYELGYELNNRPDWVSIPLAGILSLLGEEA